MPEENRQAVPEPDEFDRQLRDLTSGDVRPARFTELSAAERASRSANRPMPEPTRKKRTGWRNARKARRLRKPVTGSNVSALKRGSGRAGAARRQRPTRSIRQRRIRSIAKTVGILLAFCALLYALHLLGLGPQG